MDVILYLGHFTKFMEFYSRIQLGKTNHVSIPKNVFHFLFSQLLLSFIIQGFCFIFKFKDRRIARSCSKLLFKYYNNVFVSIFLLHLLLLCDENQIPRTRI